MHYLIKLCSLCLCEHRPLVKLNGLELKYLHFLKTVLLSNTENEIKYEELVCELCKNKLTSCFMLSELCIRNKMFTTCCCMCLSEDKRELVNLRMISTSCIFFYHKLIKLIKPETLICEKCLAKLRYYQRFYQQCNENENVLKNYILQLTSFTQENIFKNSKISVVLDKIKLSISKEPSVIEIFDLESVKNETTDNSYIDDNFVLSDNELSNEIAIERDNHNETEINLNTDGILNKKYQWIFSDDDYIVYKGDENEIQEEITTENENSFENKVSNNLQAVNTKENSGIISVEPIAKYDYKKAFLCPYCPENKKKVVLKYHKFYHIDSKKLQCLICYKYFKNYNTLYYHTYIHFDPKKRTEFLNHITNKTENFKLKIKNSFCPYCPVGTKVDNFDNHQYQHINKNTKICLICNKRYKYFKSLTAHISQHFNIFFRDSQNNQNENFNCRFCSKNTNEPMSIHAYHHIHVNLEEDKLKNICGICSKSIVFFKNCLVHVKNHLKESVEAPVKKSKPIFCSYCPGKIKILNQLEHYQFFHMDLEENKCLICSKSFFYFKSLRLHVEKHFNEVNDRKVPSCENNIKKKRHFCKLCNIAFFSAKTRIRHLKSDKHLNNVEIIQPESFLNEDFF